MRANFDAALAAVLRHEGGYVNHPKDPGGATNKGVTQAVYDAWRVDHQLPTQSVRTITPAEVMAVYKRRYWDALQCDALPSGLDYCLFDFGVNSGIRRAAEFLQLEVDAVPDSKIGPATIAAAKARPAAELVDAICDSRMAFLKGLRTYAVFGKGWARRVAEVRAAAKALAA
jgi:lysozyme family protein